MPILATPLSQPLYFHKVSLVIKSWTLEDCVGVIVVDLYMYPLKISRADSRARVLVIRMYIAALGHFEQEKIRMADEEVVLLK